MAHQELGFHITSGKICSKITRAGNRGVFSLKGPAQLDVPESSFLAGAAPALQMPGEGCKLRVTEGLPPLGSVLVSVLRPTEKHQSVWCHAGGMPAREHNIYCVPRELHDGEEGKLNPLSSCSSLWGWMVHKSHGFCSTPHSKRGRERFQHGKPCLCMSFCLQTSTACSCSMESGFQGIWKRRLDLGKKDQGLLLGGDLESLGLGDSLCILGQDGCCAAELPPVLSLLKSPIPLGSACQRPSRRHTQSAALGKANIILKLA